MGEGLKTVGVKTETRIVKTAENWAAAARDIYLYLRTFIYISMIYI